MVRCRQFYLFFLLLLLSFKAHSSEYYRFISAQSHITWSVNVLHLLNLSGEFPTSGTFVYDDRTPRKSNVEVMIHTKRVKTLFQQVTNVLKSKNFFDVARYPSAHFISHKIEITNDHAGTIKGMLTIKNITKPITLSITLKQSAIDKKTKAHLVSFYAETVLKRADFGITGYPSAVSNDIHLAIQVEAISQN
ncbi:MAG: hypothetical protein A3F14_01765 [Gammaproteobacteria bacterium RIFCSPHIGHO2_12_FULL_43_28]|nr:MAG: hypothetical protein A3F14_01765 [Gammaproteobacteria bacterium RIFCSPHIGHO2_12_FULL_43_28]